MTLDVLLESRIDDSWNVAGVWELSWSWTGFPQVTTGLAKNLQMVSRGPGED